MRYIPIIFLILSCAAQKPLVIPSDNVIEPAPGKPGYYIISAGMLKDLHNKNLLLVTELEKCKSIKK